MTGLVIFGIVLCVIAVIIILCVICSDLNCDDAIGSILLAAGILIFGGFLIYNETRPERIIKYIKYKIEKIDKNIESAKSDCNELGFSEEKCNETLLYKFYNEKAELNNKLKNVIMQKYED